MLATSPSRYDGTNFITGMRAFAALGVVFIHTGGLWFRGWGEVGNHIADMGSSGVYVFFVISGFSVSQSFETSGSYAVYLGKRLRRIVPLYFFWLAVCALVLGLPTVGWYSAAMHVTFLSFLDHRLANSVIGVEWTIAIEVFFYLLIPLVLTRCRGWIGLTLLVLASFVAYRLTYDALLRSEVPNGLLALHWSPIPYAFCFLLGVVAYRMRARRPFGPAVASVVFIGCVCLMTAYVVSPSLVTFGWFDKLTIVSLVSFAMIAAGTDTSTLLRRVFCSVPIQYLGLISYGIYLSHYPIFQWLVAPLTQDPTAAFALTLSISVAVSSATYFAIERPSKAFALRPSMA